MSDHTIMVLPDALPLHAEQGQQLLDALHEFRHFIPADCGGLGTCGKCRVQVLQGQSTLNDIERKQLTELEIDQGMRLACQQRVEGDLLIALPLRVETEDETKTRGVESLGDYPLDHGITKSAITIPQNASEDARSWLQVAGLKPSETSLLRVARSLAKLRASGKESATCVYSDGQLLALEEGDTRGEAFALAVDIGTTTVAGYLVSLNGDGVVAAASCANSQGRWGSDVLSRITAVTEQDSRLFEMQREVRDDINRLIAEMCRRAKVRQQRIYRLCVVGNPTMACLMLGIHPVTLGMSPYAPLTTEEIVFVPSELHISLPDTTRCVFAPCVSGYVGADLVAAAVATDLDRRDELAFLLDVGTNGETLLGNRHSILGGSNAAGPAFEGARISQGMRASRGAIERVRIDGEGVHLGVIGNAQPRGICGSGLIDAVAALLDSGVVEPTGKVLPPEECPPFLRERVVPTQGGYGFVLATESETALGRPVMLTQRDIREVQLATGAIAAGRRILCREAGLDETDLPRVLVAGAFGSHIDPVAAMRIGLLPRVPLERVEGVGNAAGYGACMMAMNREAERRGRKIAASTRYVEFARQPDFQDLFVESMLFPGG
ncbi:MAG: DUF4445 domain-containing protein [Fimbriimonadia bacterium]|jgi:uncharacterized 2Fe-2S/4Fe-4S cluster protein (DUF4445 family)